jgi:hypothetical protein
LEAVLVEWLQDAEQTKLPDLVGFVQGIHRDFVAVAGALEYGYRQGVVEGQINRLKNHQAATLSSGKSPSAQTTRSSLSCLMAHHSPMQATSVHQKERRT